MSTTTVAPAAPAARRAALPTILLAGGVAGLGDILYAITVWGFRGVSPVRILQSIAAGWLGRDAFTGGMATALLGTVSHFSIAIGMAAVYYAVSTRVRLLLDRPILSGTLFGLGCYVAMNYVIVPLSASPGGPPKFGWSMLIALTPHIVFVGIPIALITRRARRASPA